MIKNNAAYDLKQLFIGSEGTLGIVTRAVLKLSPLLTSQNTVLAATDRFDQVTELLNFFDRELGGQLSAFEVMWNNYYQVATGNGNHGKPAPLAQHYPYYVLVEAMGTEQVADGDRFDAVLERAFTTGLLVDAVVAKSQRERDGLWAIRDNLESFTEWFPAFVYDVSLAIPDMESYLESVQQALARQWPKGKLAIFGHLGDGNLHLIVATGSASEQAHHQVNELLYSALAPLGGSLSAEHGIGLEKRDYLHYSRSAEEIALMHSLKLALDPKGILNPGKVLPSSK